MRGRQRITSLAQLHAKCEPQSNGCILYPKVVHRYGIVTLPQGRMTANRAAYTLAFGPIKDGAEVCHRCDAPRCVNPEHLFLDSHAGNMADKCAKGRHRCARKLSESEVMQMHEMRLNGSGISIIAGVFKISYVAAQMILTGVRHRREFEQFANQHGPTSQLI